MTSRRHFLLGSLSMSLLGLSGPVLANPSARFVLVVLRGGLDGLSTLVPYGERIHSRVRGSIAQKDVFDLDGFFGLHDALEPLRPLWRAGELLPMHAVGLPYGERSHFDAQDLLENGTEVPNGARDGWLNRALGRMGGRGLSLGRSLPLVLRGEAEASSLEPSMTVKAEAEFLDEVARLYDDDPLLGPAFRQGLETRRELDEVLDGEGARSGRRADLGTLKALAALLREPGGPRVAVVEVGGWDTHSRQNNRLRTGLSALGEGLALFAEELQETWADTVVLAVSEFGRTVKVNGTGGTDHGTGGVAFAAGGRVHGGRVLSDWPGLDDLYDERDLHVTTDVRGVFKGVLAQHFGVSRADLDEHVFPGSASVAPVQLLRGG